MGLEEFGDLPSRLEDWAYETVEYLVKKYDFEPGTFDYKDVLNPTGSDRNSLRLELAQYSANGYEAASRAGSLLVFGFLYKITD